MSAGLYQRTAFGTFFVGDYYCLMGESLRDAVAAPEILSVGYIKVKNRILKGQKSKNLLIMDEFYNFFLQIGRAK